MLLNKIKRSIKQCDVVSFDIFDTLLVRPYIRPTDLFTHMEKSFAKSGFEKARIVAEGKAFANRKDREDVTLDMIYNEIDDIFKDMKQKEMNWEKMVLRANPELKQVYDYALEQGKKIVIASDMYLPTSLLSEILSKNGFYKWDKIYISGDLGKKKRSGSIYHQIFTDMDVSPNKILHIGDNAFSDYKVAKELNIKSFLYKKVLDQYLENTPAAKVFFDTVPHSLTKSIILSIMAYNWMKEKCHLMSYKNTWEWLGYNYAAPLAYGYIKFVENKAKEDKINHLLFIARDGYSFQKVFELLNSGIKSSYIYANRKLRQLTSLNTNTLPEHLDYTVQYCASKSESFAKLVRQYKFQSPHDYVDFFEKYQQLMQDLLQNNVQNYAKYIHSKVNSDDKIAIVDTMAHSFSSQKLLNDFLLQPTIGYYWAYTKSNYCKDILCTSFAETVYSAADLKSGNPKIYTKKWPIMEILFSSPEVAIDNIDKDSTPVYRKNPPFQEQLRAQNYPFVLNGILNFVYELITLFDNHNCFFEFKALVSWIDCLLEHPSNKIKIFFQDYPSFFTVEQDKVKHLFTASIPLINFIFFPQKTKRTIKSALWQTSFQTWYLKYWGTFKEKTLAEKIRKFFGLTLYWQKISKKRSKKKYLGGIIKINKSQSSKKIYLLGIQIYHKKYRN